MSGIHKPHDFVTYMIGLDDSYLGLGPTAFKNMFENLGAKEEGKYGLVWKGQQVKLPIYLISIKTLRYNLFNTRVKPHLQQYIAENNHPEDYFAEIDKDCVTTQRLINSFLSKNPDRKDALDYFTKGNEQLVQEPLIATPDGRLINGNQRLCCYRELFSKDPGKYKHLQTAYVAFLPDYGTYDEERALEATFQDTKLIGAMFDWVQQGLWLIEQLEDKSAAQIGKTIGKSEAEIKAHIGRIQLAEEFLKYIGKPNYWVMLRDEMNLNQAFQTLQKELTKLKTKNQRVKLKNLSFKLMQDTDEATKGKGTSVHLLIIKAAKRLPKLNVSKPKVSKPKSIDADPLFAPLPVTPTDEKVVEKEIDLDSIPGGDLTDLILDVDKVEVDKQKARNEKAYGEKQLKAANTSLENIIINWNTIDKNGLEKLVDEAISKLNQIKQKF